MEQDKLLTTKELAKYLGVTPSTLISYRATHTGPIYVKLGPLVRYQLSDVKIWLESKKTNN